jgi:Cu-Zn family superoxide dismutase
MRIMSARSILLLVLGAAASSSCAARPATVVGPSAQAAMHDAVGNALGDVSLTQSDAGVRFQGTLRGLPPGTHGLHVHTVGLCEAPFTSAGGHFNPTGRKHGRRSPDGPHAGDLPNVQVAADGTVNIDFVLSDVTLLAGSNSLFDDDFSALVLHEQTDDEMTDPAGNAGARIVCGVIKQ